MILRIFLTGVLALVSARSYALAGADCPRNYDELVHAGKEPVFLQVGRVPKTEAEQKRVADGATAVTRPLDANEVAGLLQAHDYGSEARLGRDGIHRPGILPDGKTNYTNRQLSMKAKILRKAGFSEAEIRTLMALGIAGEKIQAGDTPPPDPKNIADAFKTNDALARVKFPDAFFPALEAALAKLPADANPGHIQTAAMDVIIGNRPNRLLEQSEIRAVQAIAAAWHAAQKAKAPVAEAKPVVASAESFATAMQADPAIVAAKINLKDSFWPALQTAVGKLPATNKFSLRGAVIETALNHLEGRPPTEEQTKLMVEWLLANANARPTPTPAPAAPPSAEAFASAMRVDPAVAAANIALKDSFWPALQAAVGKLPTTDKFSLRGAVVQTALDHMTGRPPTEEQTKLMVEWLLANANARPPKVASPTATAPPMVATAGVARANPITTPPPVAAKPREVFNWYTNERALRPISNTPPTGSVLEKAAKSGAPFLYAVLELEDGRIVRLTTPYVAGAGHEGMSRFLKNAIAQQFMYYGAPGLKRVLGAGEAKAKMVDGKPEITTLSEISGWAFKDVPPRKNANKVADLIPLWASLEPGLVKADTTGVAFKKDDISTHHFDHKLNLFMKEIEERAAAKGIEDNFRHAIGNFVGAIDTMRGGTVSAENRADYVTAAKGLEFVFEMAERDQFVWEDGAQPGTGGKSTRYEDLKRRMSLVASGKDVPADEVADFKTDLRKFYQALNQLSADPTKSVDAVQLRGPNTTTGQPMPATPRVDW